MKKASDVLKQLMLICYDGADAEGVDLTLDECLELYAAMVVAESRQVGERSFNFAALRSG